MVRRPLAGTAAVISAPDIPYESHLMTAQTTFVADKSRRSPFRATALAVTAVAVIALLCGCPPPTTTARWVSGVSIGAGSVSWDAFDGARSYQVVIAEQAMAMPAPSGLSLPTVPDAGTPTSTAPASARAVTTVRTVTSTTTSWDPPASGVVRVAVFALDANKALLATSHVQAYLCSEGSCMATELRNTAP